MAGYNEGKAVDAVIRLIEARQGCRRADDGWSPDDSDIDDPRRRVEYVITIGDRLFAIEHTGIEPFPDQVKMGLDNKALFAPILQRFDLRSDQEYWGLHFPVEASVGLKRKRIPKVQAAMIAWIEANADHVPVVWYGDKPGNQPLGVEIPEIPFRFSLHREKFPGFSALGGRIWLHTYVAGDLEAARQDRLRAACEKKFPKLANWKRDVGAHTVLVLEDNDISLTNHQKVTDALEQAEAGMADPPDEVFLVSTYLPKRWTASCLRRPGASYYDADERFHEFDPAALAQLTEG